MVTFSKSPKSPSSTFHNERGAEAPAEPAHRQPGSHFSAVYAAAAAWRTEVQPRPFSWSHRAAEEKCVLIEPSGCLLPYLHSFRIPMATTAIAHLE